MAPWIWSLILLGIGLLIIGIEMFVPSGGLLGILSGLCILGAIIVGFTASLKFGLLMLIMVSVLLPVVFVLAVRYWPSTPIGRLIMIRPPTSDEVLPDAEARRNLQRLIGKWGIAKCQMLPGGVVTVEGRSYDAITDGTPVDPGQKVQVIAVRMNRLEVRLDDRPEDPQAISEPRSAAPAGAPLMADASTSVPAAETPSERVAKRETL
ncbi:MAG: hypothetical protein RIS70_885, partial [Planctomycetota bacterium]